MPTPASPSLERLGRYRIIKPLSKGGMALVYEARREALAGVSPRVAIKLILPQHAHSETFKQLFINEARLGASMHHQNLVQIQDFAAEGERFYLVMEFVEGINLRKVITLCQHHRIALPVEVICDLGLQVCDGLHYAHTATDEGGASLDLVHRDIKPSNLMLTPEGVVKVLDFGISKGTLREERAGSVKGTWGYMAPEQAHGRVTSPTADVFGLAVVLYELAALNPMFPTKERDDIKRLMDDDHAARMAATLDGPYMALARVLIRALQRDPKARHPDAATFGRALAHLVRDPIHTRAETKDLFAELDQVQRTGERTAQPSPKAAPAPTMLHQQPTEPIRSPWIQRLAAGVGVAAVLGGLGWVLYADMERRVHEVAPLDGEVGEIGGVREPPQTRVVGTQVARQTAAQVTEPAEARVRIDRRPKPPPEPQAEVAEAAPAEPPPPAPEEEPGLVVLKAQQRAEIYLNGRFESYAPLSKQLPPGEYTVSIVAMDGRKKTFTIDVESGKRTKKTWDFDGMAWR